MSLFTLPQFQLTEAEMESLAARAAAANLTVYEYALGVLVGRIPAPLPPPVRPPWSETKEDLPDVQTEQRTPARNSRKAGGGVG